MPTSAADAAYLRDLLEGCEGVAAVGPLQFTRAGVQQTVATAHRLLPAHSQV
jgi:hypothetical protein